MNKYLYPNVSTKFQLINIFWSIVGFATPYAAIRILHRISIIDDSFYIVLIFTSLFVAFQSIRKHNKWVETPAKNFIIGAFFYLIGSIAIELFITYKVIPEWDFLNFYLFGKVGISSSDFYNPSVFAQIFNTLNLQDKVSSEFFKEIVDVGFWYSPPSMFLFVPLGLFDLKTSYLFWQTSVISFFVIDIYLLKRYYISQRNTFFGDSNLISPVLLIILLFPHITYSAYFSQTISLFLFFLLLLIKHLDDWKAGIFLVFLIIIKPLAIVFGLYFLFFRKWKVILASAITGIVILLITILFWGHECILNYFSSPPTNRIPDYIYHESDSIFGLLNRAHGDFLSNLKTLNIRIIYYLLCFFLTLITFFRLNRISKITVKMSFIVFIPLTLLIYPLSGDYYAIMLLPVVTYIFSQNLFKNDYQNIILILSIYFIGAYSYLLLNLSLWLIIILWPELLEHFKNRKSLDNSLIHYE
jgi:hypothetical protein